MISNSNNMFIFGISDAPEYLSYAKNIYLIQETKSWFIKLKMIIRQVK